MITLWLITLWYVIVMTPIQSIVKWIEWRFFFLRYKIQWTCHRIRFSNFGHRVSLALYQWTCHRIRFSNFGHRVSLALYLWQIRSAYYGIYWLTYFFGFLLSESAKQYYADKWFIVSQRVAANHVITLSQQLRIVNQIKSILKGK